ncbi:hypothetical protein V6N13_088519 [Hibiscus sabdariffa]|uniref:Secreted protein n=1 Tax=Hibiscus sabdariffa TaxID=183260 RepID=A0ABR2FZK4_9ROSI
MQHRSWALGAGCAAEGPGGVLLLHLGAAGQGPLGVRLRDLVLGQVRQLVVMAGAVEAAAVITREALGSVVIVAG